MKKQLLHFLLVVSFCTVLPTSEVLAFTSVVTLGDSLSDNGNVKRFTDGQIWVESLANYLGANLYDFAYGGATTSYDNPAIGSSITGLQWQVSAITPLLSTLAFDDTLFTVWAGANDFLQNRDALGAVTNINTALATLYSAGVRDFLIPNLPDIGTTPYFVFYEPSLTGAATTWTSDYNAYLASMLQDFGSTHTDANVYPVDVFTIFDQYAVGGTDWAKLFWTDGFHPSSAGHELIYEAARSAVAPVPEPGTILLLCVGIVCFLGVGHMTGKSV